MGFQSILFGLVALVLAWFYGNFPLVSTVIPSHWRQESFQLEQESAVELLDKILGDYLYTIGADYQGYRNHCQRVMSYTIDMIKKAPADSSAATETFDKIATAVAFHDIGLWTAKTVDYIDPSEKEAMLYLDSIGKKEWKEEIGLMITRHHQTIQGELVTDTLPETFRRADLVDFTWGLVRWDVPRGIVLRTQESLGNAGFHWGLVKKAVPWTLQNPLNPVPMVRWN